jgi:hypothetical protein
MVAKPQNPRFTRHAKRRWEGEGDIAPRREMDADISFRRAWEQSFPIEIPPHWPYGPNLTYHPPTRALFVWGPDDQRKYGKAVTTVLDYGRAENKYGELTNNPLTECEECRNEYDVEQERACPWCAASAEPDS